MTIRLSTKLDNLVLNLMWQISIKMINNSLVMNTTKDINVLKWLFTNNM